jgi:hypothetical protein
MKKLLLILLCLPLLFTTCKKEETVTLTNGVPIETVSKMLGHNNIKTTQIYARVIDSKVSQDMLILRNKLY